MSDKRDGLTFEELAEWIEKMRSSFYLGCRTDPHSLQVNEFVRALHYYLEKDFGFVSKQREKKD